MHFAMFIYFVVIYDELFLNILSQQIKVDDCLTKNIDKVNYYVFDVMVELACIYIFMHHILCFENKLTNIHATKQQELTQKKEQNLKRKHPISNRNRDRLGRV
uniref:Uncharacterized protein n=1 Tax=Solanum lycopersicum TaxID=4081 RepID=A0A3Q7IU53_SOLLC